MAATTTIPNLMANDAAAWSGCGNVYVSLNPAHPDCKSRALNRTVWAGKGGLTKDHEITHRTTLLIDCDPDRLKGIPSSETEHKAGLDLAQTVRDHLSGQGWPEPIMTDSGNGAALLYRIDLPTDDGGLVHRVLDALSKRFNTPAVKIDQSVDNASRITRLPGTLNMKGENLPERPHRLARIVSAPAKLELVTREQLEQLTSKDAGRPGDRQSCQNEFEVSTWPAGSGEGYRIHRERRRIATT